METGNQMYGMVQAGEQTVFLLHCPTVSAAMQLTSNHAGTQERSVNHRGIS